MLNVRRFIFLSPIKVNDTEVGNVDDFESLVRKDHPDASCMVLWDDARMINAHRFNPDKFWDAISAKLMECGYDPMRDVIGIAGDIPIFTFLGSYLRERYGRYRVGIYNRSREGYWVTTV